MKSFPRLIFIDRDTPQVNNFTYNLFGDKDDIFGYNCTTYEDDREGEPQTAISCSKYRSWIKATKSFQVFFYNFVKIFIFSVLELWARKNIEITEASYPIILQINDTSLLPGNGDSTVSSIFQLYFIKNLIELFHLWNN